MEIECFHVAVVIDGLPDRRTRKARQRGGRARWPSVGDGVGGRVESTRGVQTGVLDAAVEFGGDLIGGLREG